MEWALIGFSGWAIWVGRWRPIWPRRGTVTGYDVVSTTAEGVAKGQGRDRAGRIRSGRGHHHAAQWQDPARCLRRNRCLWCQGALYIGALPSMASATYAHGKARPAGLQSLDAPVSGGVAARWPSVVRAGDEAAAGTLTFMIGGDATALCGCVTSVRDHGPEGGALRRRGAGRRRPRSATT